MDNKLSELSKPVAEVVSKFGDPEAFGEREIKLLTGIQQMAYGTKLYSQEYVSSITQRIAELERANQSQDDHINQQQDRIESLEKTNAGLGRRLGDAEKWLATPVRLPTQEKYDDPLSAHLAINDSAEAIRAAGFKVEGDK